MSFYSEAVYLKDAIDFQKCAQVLDPLFPENSQTEVQAAFEQYFWEDSLSDELSREDEIEEDIKAMMIKFIAENQNESKSSAKVALELQMPLCDGNISKIYEAGAWL
jgi:hypothetical protein